MSSSDSEIPPFDHNSTFKHTTPPNPGWTYGQRLDETPAGREWQAGEKAGWHYVDATREEPSKLYSLMLSGIIPRPIAFVSSISESGIENLAPFSWFNMVSANPGVISISSGRSTTGGVKDTVNNIRTTKGFTVNIISEAWAEQSNSACIEFPADIDEWPVSGLTREPSVNVKAPRVKESAFSMECELFQAIDIVHPTTGKMNCTLILGLVKSVHVRKDVLNERGLVDPSKLKPIARLGDLTYSTLGDGFRLPRPAWEDESVQEAIKAIGVDIPDHSPG